MQVLCAKEAGNTPGEGRPLEGFLRGKRRKANPEEQAESGAMGEGTGSAAGEEPFGFYRPDPEDVERDRVARRLWKQVFG